MRTPYMCCCGKAIASIVAVKSKALPTASVATTPASALGIGSLQAHYVAKHSKTMPHNSQTTPTNNEENKIRKKAKNNTTSCNN